MRVPLSWLREYVDLPAVTAHEVADKLTAAGLEVESISSHGHDIKNVVVGEVLEIEELTGFKKPIRYCQVEVGEADAARDRLRRRPTSPSATGCRSRCPGARAARRVRDRRAQDLRPHVRGHDLLRARARHRRRPRRHPGAAAPTRPIGADVVELLGLRDDVLELEITPDRGYALSIRGVAREAATALRRAVPRPRRRRAARRRRSPS